MKYLSTFVILIGLASCGVSSKPFKYDFFVMQNLEKVAGEEITLENKPFTLSSSGKKFSYVFSKKKITLLEGKKKIVKVSLSTGISFPDASLYEADDLYSDASACKIYYGNQGKSCQKFIKVKKELGLEDELAYSFTDFSGKTKSFLIESIDNVKLSKMQSQSYYVYFFTFLQKIGEVEELLAVDKIKINIKN